MTILSVCATGGSNASGRLPRAAAISSRPSTLHCRRLRQIDHDVAEAVEHRLGIGGNDAGGIVFLDNAGSLPTGGEVRACQHRHLEPTSLGAEISPATDR